MARRFAWLIIALTCGSNAMAQSDHPLSLTWQWGGVPAHRVAVRVSAVNAQAGGLFGINHSPSMAGNVPDARIVTGEIVAGDGGGEVVLKIPAHELPAVKAGDVLAIFYTQDGHAVCVAVPPAGGEAVAAWLAAWVCPPRA